MLENACLKQGLKALASILQYMLESNTSSLSLLETRILWVISKKPSHGYAILKELNLGRKKKTTNGTLYPIMQKLLKQKMISMKKTGTREKKIYSISEKGKKELKEACLEFCQVFSEIFNSFVCKKCGSGVKKA